MIDNGAVADQIIEYLRKELVLYESIYKLTVSQKESIRASDTDLLMGILNQKQRYIQKIALIQRSLVSVTGQWSAIKDSTATARRTLIEDLTEKVKTRLYDIILLEKENMSLVQSRKEVLEIKMQRNRAGKNTINQYLSGDKSNGALIMDRRL